MGMSASQARLLSITARLSNNELEQQSIAHSKQRLAENSEQANNTYLDAMSKTKYQILTGYNGNSANYQDLTYAQLTGASTVAVGKQYIVKSRGGQVLVSSQIAKAFKDNNGDFNKFLRDLGYTQCDIDITNVNAAKNLIHEAWDRYLVSVGKGVYDANGNTENSTTYEGQHILGFGYTSFSNDGFDGYPTYKTTTATSASGNSISLMEDINGYYKERTIISSKENADGETVVGYTSKDSDGNDVFHTLENVTYDKENHEYTYTDANGNELTSTTLYIDPETGSIADNIKDYLTYSGSGQVYYSGDGSSYYVRTDNLALNYEGTTQAQRDLYDYAVALTASFYNSNSVSNLQNDTQMLTYYKNIFNEMRQCGYTTLEESYAQKLSITTAGEYMTSENKVFNDSNWLVRQLKAGNLTLSYYSIADKRFIGTTMDDDQSITEREDTSSIKIAEQVYKNQMDKIEKQDKQFDLELTKLESEHNALQTEYESVKKVISTNVEKSFNTFNA